MLLSRLSTEVWPWCCESLCLLHGSQGAQCWHNASTAPWWNIFHALPCFCVRDRLSLADEGHCMSLLIKTEDTEDKVHTSQVICNSRQASHRDRHAGAETIFFSQQRACESLVSVSCYPKRCCILCYIGHYHTMLNMNVSFGSVVTQRVWLPHYMLHEGAKDKKIQKFLPIYGIDSTSQLCLFLFDYISFWLYLWLYDISTICTRTYTHTHSYCIHIW